MNLSITFNRIRPAFRWVFAALFVGLQTLAPFGGQFGDAEAAPAPDPAPAPVKENGQPRPSQVAVPSLTLSPPASVMLGEQFTFTASFDNTGADVGYGPFMDIVFPATGVDGAVAPPDDGITFVSASYLGAAIPADQITIQTFPDDGSGAGCVQHPIAVRPANDSPVPSNPEVPRYYSICGNAGDQLVTIVLPFGSFVPSQPAADVTITAQLSDLADLGAPLGIRGQAGFQFGNTPINDFCCTPYDATLPFVAGGEYDTSGWAPQNVTPALMTLSKVYVGPENETATGPNFPRQFTITVDIAAGQTISGLKIVDDIPENIQFVSIDVPNASEYTVNGSLPSTTSPGGSIDITLNNSVTGGPGTNDATLTFTYYVDRLDSSSSEVVPSGTGVPATSDNSASASGTWDPIDPRDDTSPLPTATATCGAPCVSVEDQSIVVQKGVSVVNDVSPAGNTPGDVLEYTLDFQVSDFFGFDGINLTDTFSDGQRLDTTFAPTIQLNGNGGNDVTVASALDANNVDITCKYSGASVGAGCDVVAAVDLGRTTITFNISDELNTRFSNSQLLGGCVDPNAANNPPSCSAYNDGGTTGTITFRTIIQDDFSDDFPSGDRSVDHGDILRNTVDQIVGSVLDISVAPVSGVFSPTANTPVDDSSAEVTIAFGGLDKSIYAVNGSTTIPTYLSPGDVITYRLTYTQPTSDFEQTVLTDFLPLPVFSATELGASGNLTNQTCVDLGYANDVPPAGQFCLMDASTDPTTNDTYHLLNVAPVNEPNPIVTATYATDAAANTVTITYPTYDSVTNTSSTIDILFSLTVESDPFADGLFLTNQANAVEGTTNAGDQQVNDIVQIQIGEPVLMPAKTAVSSDHAPAGDIIFTPNQSIMTQFAAPGGSGAPFSGTISSNSLSTDPTSDAAAFDLFNSVMEGVDANDLVKYAIVIENRGHGADGAFDIAISDIFPSGMQFPGGSSSNLNLQVYNGAGTAFTFEVVDYGSDGLYGTADDVVTPGNAGNAQRIFDANYAIRVVDPAGPSSPGACQLADLVSGANIIVITYDLQVQSGLNPETSIINTASLVGYGSQEGGANFLTTPENDDAQVITKRQPGFTKVLTASSVDNANNGANEVVIGEVLTYTITTQFYELSTPAVQIVDTLDAGLAFVDVVSVTNSNPTDLTSSVMTFDGAGLCTNCTAGTTSGSNPLIENSGGKITFDFGDITNANLDDAAQETITIVYRAVATNIVASQAGGALGNSANLTWTTGSLLDNDNDVSILEPTIATTKNANPSATDAGNTVTYTVTLTNGNAATDTDAYDVAWSDTLPAGMIYVAGSLALGVCPNAPDTLSDAAAPTFSATWDGNNAFPKNASCEITFAADIDYSVTPGDTLTNTADTVWTSLPGTVNDVSVYDTASDERTGVDGVGGALNDYASSGSADVTITNPVTVKYLQLTSEAHTSDAPVFDGLTAANARPVAIGEIIRFRIVTTIPEGTSPNFQVSDHIPAGLIFLNDNTTRISFVSNSGIVSTGFDAIPAVPNICNAVGSVADASTPASLLCALADGNIASTMTTTTNTDSYSPGADVNFRLGNLVNSDSDADAEYVVIEFNTIAHNSATSRNDANERKSNFVRTFINGAQNGNDSNSVQVRIAEPHLTINKALTTAANDAGDPMTYAISISNDADTFFAGSNSAAAAFDLNLSDPLDAYLDLQNAGDVVIYADGTNGSSDLTGGSCGNVAQSITDNSSVAADTVSIDITCLNPGETVVVSVTAYVRFTAPAGYAIPNTATVTGTSLPGAGTPDGSPGNSTGTTTPGASGALDGERDGSGGVGSTLNDYIAASTVNQTLNTVQPVKSIVSTDQTHTSEAGDGSSGNPRDLAIGEVIRYRLAVELPEGTSVNLSLEDTLPLGFSYVGDSSVKISFIADADVTEPADLAGADNDALPPTFPLPASRISVSGQNVIFTVGTLTNNDNNDANAEYVLIEFDVRVNDDANNNNTDLDSNDFEVYLDGTLASTSNAVQTRIVEPLLNIAKTADDATWLYGQTVTYTLTVTHTAASLTDAFDLVLTDTIPSGLTYGSVTSNPANWTVSYAAPTLTLSCLSANSCSLPNGSTAVIQFTATVDSPPAATALIGTDTATNNVAMTWTSLPGADAGERNGTSGNAWDDYADSATHDGGVEYYALGNRVWFDTDNSATINGAEVGVAGVTVQLYRDNGTGTFVDTGKTSVTDANGYYLFDYLEADDYMVVIPASQFGAGGALEGYYSSQTFRNNDGSLSETAAPDADADATDSDDNGLLDTVSGEVRSLPVTLGPTGNTEPITDNDFANGASEDSQQPDGRSNLSVDFGFYKTEIGDLVYLDENANGVYASATDSPLDGVTVQLYAADGTTLLATTTTAGGGLYLFTGLPDGDYIVRVTTPSGLVSAIDTFDSADNADPDISTDDNDNGIGIGQATSVNVSSGVLTMAGGETGTTITANDANGTTTDLSVDFGFTYAYALGNRVWFDTDNNSAINGSEVGVDGVSVQLFLADGAGAPTGSVLATDTTSGGGYYLFDYLTADDYVVVIPASNFGAGAVLEGYWSSATQMQTNGTVSETRVTGATDDDADSDDNGLLVGGDVVSVAVTLGPTGNTEPSAESDLESGVGQGTQPDGRANMTVDFGFYKTEIGNLVFSDSNKNGIFDGAEAGINGMTVQLFNADGTVEILVGADGVLGTTDDSAGGMSTDASGLYKFSGLPEGDYIVRAAGLSNFTSTIDTAPSNTPADVTDPDTNVDDNDNGIGTNAGAVDSGQLTMAAAESATNIAVSNATGTTTDLTVDFGFINAYALGNRVWYDTDNSATINGTEVGIDGITVKLYATADLSVALATTTTANGGYYLFDYLDAGDYVVVIPATEFSAGGALDGYWSSQTTMSNAGAISETAAPDVDVTATDSDDNGTLDLDTLNFPGAVISAPITLGTGASEPIGESDLDAGNFGNQPDAQSNMTVDFGFYKTGIGNLVWLEGGAAVDGVYNAADDTLLSGVTVKLYAANGATEIQVGADGILGTADDAVGGVLTNASGQYAFDGLPQGSYIVKTTAPSGTLSTIDSADQTDNDAPDTNTDNNDNGDGQGGGEVASAALTMTPGSTGAQTNNTVSNASGSTFNPTLDFGFAYIYALGNRVWFDTNNNSAIDFGAEQGADGVVVQLYAADASGNPTGAVLATDTTSGGGYYLFDNLFPGDYVVVIPEDNFRNVGAGDVAASDPLEGYWSSATSMNADGTLSETAAPDPDNDLDSDDNGTRQTGGGFSGAVISQAVTLGPLGLTEPTAESDLESGVGQGTQPDGRANMTVDFGFYKTEIGNLVFGDVDKNGAYNAGDTLYSGVTVQLYSSNGTEINLGADGILNTADDAAGGMVTNASGEYRFSGLPAGDYIVRVTAPNGTVSTIDSYDQTDNDDPDTNTDNNDNGVGVSDGAVSANTLTMTAAESGTNITVNNATGITTDLTVDFGFTTVFALGNRVWYDTNDDALINNGEVGVDGVTVQLYAADVSGNPTGAILATDTTANGGYYLFDYLPAGDYVVVIPSTDNFAAGKVLEGYWSSLTSRNADGSLSEVAAPAPNNDTDLDDNGTRQTSGGFSGDVISQAVTLGATAVEPTNEGDLDGGSQGSQPDAQANMTVDFGFYTMTLGNLVWDDANTLNNGLYESATESGIDGVDVQLWSQDGATMLDSVTTAGGGLYSFSGLAAGDYILRIPAAEFEGIGTLRDYVTSVGAANAYEPAPDADINTTDSDDNGSQTGGVTGLGGYVQTEIVTLTPAGEASYDNNTGTTSEPRVDFGLFNSPQTDLAITKDDGQTFYLQGGSLTYSIVVTNNGPADVIGAVVSDAIPAQFSSWTWACTSSTGGASGCTAVTNSTANFSDTINLPKDAVMTYTVTATIGASASGALTNTVSVAPPSGTTETNTTNNSASDTDNPAILSITKDDGLSVVAPGKVITYTIDIYNGGAVPLTDLTLVDTLPSDVTYQSATPAPSSIAGNVLTWNHAALGLTGSLGIGGSVSVSLTVRVNDTPSGASITNSAVVTDSVTNSTAADVDTDTLATTASKTLVSTSEPDSTDPAVFIGETLNYSISITVPPGVMTNLQARDILEAGLAFDECTGGVTVTGGAAMTTTLPGGFADACPAASGDPNVTNSGHDVLFDFGTVTNTSVSDQTITVEYTAVVLNIAANVNGVTGLNNAVTWTWDGGSLGASATPVEIIEPVMTIDKIVTPERALLGSTLTYTIDIAHDAISAADAYDVVLTDVIPAGLTYNVGSLTSTGLPPTSTVYDVPTNTLTIIWDYFPLLATSQITFTATFIGPAPVVNAANVAWTSLPIDPQPDGSPVVQSNYNAASTERWYDPADLAGVNGYGAASSATVLVPRLPETGFAPGRVTQLPKQPAESAYAEFESFALEIPRLDITMPIVGVPTGNQGWDLTWLGNQAGWLEGTAYPTWAGNTALTGHTYLADGTPGPFVNLGKLYWGDKIIIRANGQVYTYQVRETRTVMPYDLSVLRHESYDWITLITCKDYNERADAYQYRIAVRAILIDVQPE